MKVYVVTDGEYSDYHIEQVFLNETKANAYAEMIGGGVNEYETRDDQECVPLVAYDLLYNVDLKTTEPHAKTAVDNYEVKKTNSIDWRHDLIEYGEVTQTRSEPYRYLKFRRSFAGASNPEKVLKAGWDTMWMAIKYRSDGFTIEQVNAMLNKEQA